MITLYKRSYKMMVNQHRNKYMCNATPIVPLQTILHVQSIFLCCLLPQCNISKPHPFLPSLLGYTVVSWKSAHGESTLQVSRWALFQLFLQILKSTHVMFVVTKSAWERVACNSNRNSLWLNNRTLGHVLSNNDICLRSMCSTTCQCCFSIGFVLLVWL